MICSKFDFRALLLSASLIFGLMASTSVAHAETGAKWRVNGADVGSLAPQLEISEVENKTGSLSFTTKGGTSVLILCTATKFTEGGKLLANGSISTARVLGTGCSVLLNEVAAPKCSPHSPGKLKGEILSEKITGLIVLSEGSDLVKFSPEKGTLYLSVELGETCAIGEAVRVEAVTNEKGEVQGPYLKDCKGNAAFTEERVTHLVEEGPNRMVALGQPAKTIGSANFVLTGAHKGLSWSGVPA